MPTLVKLIDHYANYLYIICGLLLIPFLSGIKRARLDRQSIFPLEKENATKRLRRAISGVVLVLGIATGTYYISSYVEPTIVEPNETPTPTPTRSLLFPTPTSPSPTPTETPTAMPTATRQPRPPTPQEGEEPTDTPTPTPEKVIVPNCPNPGVRITSPGVSAALTGTVEIRGSATIENFGYYKFEFQSLSTADEWHHVYTSEQPVSDGVLGSWNIDPLPAGEYLFQLVVVDATGNYPPPCQVRVSVKH
jgi:hypothetical protein